MIDRFLSWLELWRADRFARREARKTLADAFTDAGKIERALPDPIDCNSIACHLTTPHVCRREMARKFERPTTYKRKRAKA